MQSSTQAAFSNLNLLKKIVIDKRSNREYSMT